MATLKDDFLPEFLGNKNRSRIIRVFVFNPNDVMTLSDLVKRSGVPAKAALKEVKSLIKIGMVKPSRSVSITLANKSKRTVKGSYALYLSSNRLNRRKNFLRNSLRRRSCGWNTYDRLPKRL